jgi:hypothetical protein
MIWHLKSQFTLRNHAFLKTCPFFCLQFKNVDFFTFSNRNFLKTFPNNTLSMILVKIALLAYEVVAKRTPSPGTLA